MERKKIESIKRKAGVSAVVGVVLMVAITVAITATVYVYVTGMVDNNNAVQKEIDKSINVSGILRSMVYVDCYDITIGNVTINNVYIQNNNDYLFLLSLVGKDCTVTFKIRQSIIGGNTTYYYKAILN